MIATTPLATAGWTDQQRALFQAQMSNWQKDEVVGVLLALFLGTFGAHHFYLRRTGLGILYLIFSFTGIPTIVSLVECFFMPGRVRQYNQALAVYFAGQLATVSPVGYGVPTGVSVEPAPATNQAVLRTCNTCGAGILPGANFCARCGSKV
ncbi:TM2 domain-containing membrane protein YozV [Silvibacterium bohemicum]|uniref:TM2 domain-containing membrane protein YozV n=1 Tax=Silvibacterium bohemicum TaxID=1577686 RepID=A0A841JXZ1_9BACT|nr:TM2 domain-containing protein [Silvibacterium bohemicum]MBB6146206.1 TM2 domain-containing membrane protein YozV [Silvibacterium bohemicum]